MTADATLGLDSPVRERAPSDAIRERAVASPQIRERAVQAEPIREMPVVQAAPAGVRERPVQNDFDTAYAAQQKANAAGTGGGSPITPDELKTQRATTGQSTLGSIGQGFVAGMEKLPVKLAQGIESGMSTPAVIGNLPRAFSPGDVDTFSRGVDAAHPHAGVSGTAGEVAGGAPLAFTAAALGVPPTPLFAAQGAAGGAATAEDRAFQEGRQA